LNCLVKWTKYSIIHHILLILGVTFMGINIVGNANIMSQIDVATQSAFTENRSLPHTLFSGAAGCGKTSTARYIALNTGCKFLNISPDGIKKREDLFPIINALDKTGYDRFGRKTSKTRPSILFIDEIHGLSLMAQEFLGIMMEEWYLPATSKEAAKSPDYTGNPNEPFIAWVPEFTLIGATTNDGMLSKPFRDRFKLRFLYTTYDMDDSISIVMTHAESMKLKIEKDAAAEIAKRGRGVGRIIVGLLERCRDMAVFHSQEVITRALAEVTFHEMGIDASGLTSIDIKLMKILYETGVPVGLENLAIQLNESQRVLSEVTEPYLIRRGFVSRVSKGRILTNAGRRYLIEGKYVDAELSSSYIIPKRLHRT